MSERELSGSELIVVGAGAAGAVIAARVSERHEREVTLLEAGPDYDPTRALPGDLSDGTRNSLLRHDWGYRHRPTKRQVVFPLPRGKVVGGSSAVNTCIGLRGVPSDYDEWAERGLPDWSWERCLPAFKRLETDLDMKNEWHGDTGPIPLRRHPRHELAPWHAAFLDACESEGHPRVDDHNHPRATGFGPHAMNKIDGQRMSVARCYLDAATRARANLRIVPRTLVRRVLFAARKVVGVEIERDGVVQRLSTKRVVLSAGAIATPGILLRSGVGPRAEVTRLGVELVADVPAVGARLLDHPGIGLFLAPKPGVLDLKSPIVQVALRLRSRGGAHLNDIQIQSAAGVHQARFSLPLVSLLVQVGKPKGAGKIRYESASPHERPQIASEFLEHPVDRSIAMEGLDIALSLWQSDAMRGLATPLIPLGPVLRRRAWLEGAVRHLCDSGFHPSGTVPMGADGDREAATDGRGRVRGVEGLVVADASLMPTIPTANTHLPTVMIGERFGEWLRNGEL